MSELLKFEQDQIASLGKKFPDFKAGDSVVVTLNVKEGDKERKQKFAGVCIARRNRGIGSTFRVRKQSFGFYVERLFSLYSPSVVDVEVQKVGVVRRAKLYYLRDREGKGAKIREKVNN